MSLSDMVTHDRCSTSDFSTCYVDKLTHHMNRCPSRPKVMPAYYSKGINAGDNAGELVPEPKSLSRRYLWIFYLTHVYERS